MAISAELAAAQRHYRVMANRGGPHREMWQQLADEIDHYEKDEDTEDAAQATLFDIESPMKVEADA